MLKPAGIRYHYKSIRYQGLYVHRITRKHTHPLSSALPAQRHSAAPCGARAVPCLAVRCSAVPCCAVLCCSFFRTYQTTTLASRRSWREPASPWDFFTALLVKLLFPFCVSGSFFNTLPEYSSSSMYEYVVVGYLRQYHEHSTAQRNHHCTKQQTEYVRIRVHI